MPVEAASRSRPPCDLHGCSPCFEPASSHRRPRRLRRPCTEHHDAPLLQDHDHDDLSALPCPDHHLRHAKHLHQRTPMNVDALPAAMTYTAGTAPLAAKAIAMGCLRHAVRVQERQHRHTDALYIPLYHVPNCTVRTPDAKPVGKHQTPKAPPLIRCLDACLSGLRAALPVAPALARTATGTVPLRSDVPPDIATPAR